MSVLRRGRNEMAAVHLVHIYCVPTLVYVCEIWNFSSSDYHIVSFLWSNAFRRILNCCWRESTVICVTIVLWMPSCDVVDCSDYAHASRAQRLRQLLSAAAVCSRLSVSQSVERRPCGSIELRCTRTA